MAQHQLLLGDDAFVAGHHSDKGLSSLQSIAKVPRRLSALMLEQYEIRYRNRDEAMARAYWSTAFSMTEIGAYLGVGYSTVSRAVNRYAQAAPHWCEDYNQGAAR